MLTKALGITGITTGVFGVVQPVLAEITNVEPMSGWQQFGVCGGAFGLLALVLLKTLPSLAREHARNMAEASVSHDKAMAESAKVHKEGLILLAVEVGGLRNDIKENLEQQLEVLRRAHNVE